MAQFGKGRNRGAEGVSAAEAIFLEAERGWARAQAGRRTELDWAGFRRARIADDLALGLSPEAAVAAAALAEQQTRARLDWLCGRFERLGELWAFLGAFWDDFFAAHPQLDDEDPDPADLPPDPPEQAELESIEAQIAAARDHDVWPRHLYFGSV